MTSSPEYNKENHGCTDPDTRSSEETGFPRIGLALSGGGFRASLFHLGVIRRLEELGIMRRIDTISAVSGGSIIAAYYVIEMEKRLRRSGVDRKDVTAVAKERLTIFKDIAECFCRVLDKNIRSRAMVFGPFYHPLLFLRSLLSGYSRSDVLQKEYDKWFYFSETVDHLPVFAKTGGPKVILNATSLLTGKRREFTRRPVSGINELGRINRNVLKLSRVIGASSGVPGLFPPTTISGDVLVDGGVSDNQGIEALLPPVDSIDRPQPAKTKPSSDDCESPSNSCDDFDVLLVSDAAGQLELAHRVGSRILKVLRRTVSVLQYQARQKLIHNLLAWKGQGCDRAHDQDARNGGKTNGETEKKDVKTPGETEASARDGNRSFAFVHLFLNLKDRNIEDRVPSEFIPALGRIRTDLDQFSHIEREVLMYHGYTVIDAQLKRHCNELWQQCCKWCVQRKLLRPPLFTMADEITSKDLCDSEVPRRRRVKQVLAAGSQSLFILRSRAKYPRKWWAIVGPMFGVTMVPLVGGLIGWADALRVVSVGLYTERMEPVVIRLTGLMPEWMQSIWIWLWQCIDDIATEPMGWLVVGLVLWFYLMLFLTFEIMRIAVCKWDKDDYKRATSTKPSVRWDESG